VAILNGSSSKLVYEASLASVRGAVSLGGEDLPVLFNTQILDKQGRSLGPNNVLVPDKFKSLPSSYFGKVGISDVWVQDPAKNIFGVKLMANRISPFVWLDVEGVKGYFSDNAFTMIDKEYEVRFTSWDAVSLEKFKKKLTVKTLGDLFQGRRSSFRNDSLMALLREAYGYDHTIFESNNVSTRMIHPDILKLIQQG